MEQGGEVTPYYDPMIAKLIVHAPNRATRRRPARQRLPRLGNLAGENQCRLPRQR